MIDMGPHYSHIGLAERRQIQDMIAAGVLNVLEEELPEERKSRFLPFPRSAAGYAMLLMAAA
jgi:hypothetical protein